MNENINNNTNNDGDKRIQIPVERHRWPDEIAAEKKAKRSRFISFLVVALSFFTIGTFIGSRGVNQTNNSFGMNKIGEIESLVSENWYFGKDIENIDEFLSDKSIKGMLDFPDIDKHTTYMSREEMEQYSQNLSGTYVGIGIQYYQDENKNFVVQKVFPASPAAKSGILAGDMVTKIDETKLEGKSTDDVKDLVLGEEGTELSVTVMRGTEEHVYKMTREEVAHSVNFEVLDNAGYVELTQFGESTAKEVAYALEEFDKKDKKTVIVDLRDNGGGYLTSVVDIAGYFIGDNEVVLIQENKAGQRAEERTKAKETFSYDKVVVLINENTASASEVLVAALQYHLDNVEVVGTNSYGKGTVQTTTTLGDGSALKYTIAEWLTPGADKINGVGIKPDYEVNLHPILTSSIVEFDENDIFKYDDVSEAVAMIQSSLDFLGYDVVRDDGYFDQSTVDALKDFQKNNGLPVTGELNQENYNVIFTSTIREWNVNQDKYDVQYKKAVQCANE